ncbi:alpha/beta fold hydrolase [Microbispora sp. KK1-11]|uniref:alpha/beta fold hydrolase n=1 Tax=Microbispora sp. KK1-11 TaxID=2053005 RepID=UPI00115BDEC9|nr:alpha/beta fold hydrolase [Microbispora sp. KK1-11]TQS28977.1 alpha/beta hydrolase [Microbispora sp. KK1-11]
MAFAAALMLLGGSGSAALAAPVRHGTGTAGTGTAWPGTVRGAEHAVAAPASAVPGRRAAGVAEGPSVEEHPCPVAVPSGTTCGYLLAPERRDVPNSRTIKVGYAVHRASQASGQAADPVVYMSGGPGSASLQLTGFLAQMFPDRDVVVLEQRGGRYSEPRLSCPEIVRGVVDTLRTPGPTSAETAPLARQALACQSRLEGEHVDLRGYRTAEIASDVVDLRAALGYPRWYLFGVSYSTRPMLLAAGRDPQGTRGVVLDSLLPASARWYDESSAALSATMTKLGIAARFDAMVKALNAHPATYETKDPLTRKRLTVQLNGDDVATILGEALHETDVIPIVPALVDGLASGRTELLQPLVDAAGDGLTSHEWGLYYAVQCQDETPHNSFPDSRGPRLFTGVVDAAVCDAWDLPAARAEPDLLAPGGWVTTVVSKSASSEGASPQGATPASSDGTSPEAATAATPPVLVLGGQYDPTTPPEAARQAVSAVQGARFAEFAGVGHAVFLSSACSRQTIAAFLDDPAATARACDPGAAPYPIVRPGDLLLTSSAYRLSRSPIPLGVPAAFLLVSAVQLVAGLVSLLRRRGGGLSALAGLAGVALCGLSALSLSGIQDVTTLAIGVPHALAWYGLLALVSTGLSIVEAFRLNAAAARIVPALTGLAFLAWLYGWLLS